MGNEKEKKKHHDDKPRQMGMCVCGPTWAHMVQDQYEVLLVWRGEDRIERILVVQGGHQETTDTAGRKSVVGGCGVGVA